MALALNGQVTHNRGGHPYVVVYETDPALRALEAISGKNRIGSSPRGARTFHAPVSVTINGVEHVVTGIGDFFYDEETTTEMRRTARGKPKYTTTTTRVEGSGRRYVYLQEQRVAVASGPVGPSDLDGLTPDEREHWGGFAAGQWGRGVRED
jgi:hypothetical protein